MEKGIIARKLAGRLRRAQDRGFRRSVRVAIDLAALRLLQPVFGFDRWHARSPTSRRGYRSDVASMINDLHPHCVVDVGCGLGAILSRVRAPERFGYDIDRGAVRAARLRRGGALMFREGSFGDVTQLAIDVLVALNWLHDFPPEQVAAWLVPLLPRTRHVLVDRVEPTSPLTYGHHHDFAFLYGLATATRIERFGEDHRRFILYEVH